MSDKFKDDTFLARWLNGQLTEEELAAFESHEDYQTYKKIAESAEGLEMPDRDKASGWEALSQKMEQQPEKAAKVRRLTPLWRYAAAAAVFLIVAYLGFFRGNSLEVHTTLMAEQEVVELPDGSKVFLNAASELRYDKKGFDEERNLELSGEAFFEVKEGSAFTVETSNGGVRVLGTSFNVRSRNSEISVTCYTGKVGLSFDAFQQMEILNPGDRIIAEGRQISHKDKIEVTDGVPGWTVGQSRFIQAEFKDVIEELERQFDVSIEYPAEINDLPAYNGGFPHSELETALDIVFSSVNYQYKINGKEVVVYN